MGAEPALRLANSPHEATRARGAERAIAFPVVVRIVALLDVGLLVAGAAFVALTVGSPLPTGPTIVAAAMFVHATAFMLRARDAYRADHLARFARASRIASVAVLTGTAWFGAVAWLLLDMPSRGVSWVLLTAAVGAALLAGGRAALSVLIRGWRASGRLSRNVAVIGANDYSRSFIETVRADPASGLSVIGVYDDRLNRVAATHAAVRVHGNVCSLIADSRGKRIDAIVVALPLTAHDRIAEIRQRLSPTVADIFLTADTAGLRYDGRDFEALGRNGVIRVGSRPLSDWDAAVKDAFDRVLAAALLLTFSPLLLAIALAIRLDSPGPALFRQPRLGFNNRSFMVFKFRSMYAQMADLHADRQTTRNDRRVTRLGKLLRRSSLDELPQLLNVLRGEMSLVGPRPHAANTKAEDRLFDEVVADYALRHRIRPGITGWAQVNGWRGETARIEQIEQRVAHDLAYIENWSLLLDVKILVMTAFGGFSGKNAY